MHAPEPHAGVALSSAHALPQAPQLWTDASEVQWPPQHAAPAPQESPHAPQLVLVPRVTQAPPQHACPARQAFPHAPQF